MRTWRTVTGVLAAVLVTACGQSADGQSTDGGGEVDDSGATAALERQRDDVRTATQELVEATVARLPGTAREARGSWRGCESGGVEEFRTFRYLAQSRVDAAPDARRPYLEALRAVLEDAGFAPADLEPGPGGGSARRLTAIRDSVTASLAEVPEAGDHVLVTVSGECVEVPEDQRGDWLVKDDPTPIG